MSFENDRILPMHVFYISSYGRRYGRIEKLKRRLSTHPIFYNWEFDLFGPDFVSLYALAKSYEQYLTQIFLPRLIQMY